MQWTEMCKIIRRTRKSSCVNARGIPPATYQVLHLLSYSWMGGVDRQTPVKKVPSHRTTYAGGKNVKEKYRLWYFTHSIFVD